MKELENPKTTLIDHIEDMLVYNEISYKQYIKAFKTISEAPQGHDLHYYSKLVNEAWETE